MDNSSRKINTIRNIWAGLVNKLVNSVLPFIIRTIIIYKLGAEYAGLGGLFSSILQVLSVSELGFSSAITFSLYRPVAENNTEEIQEWITLYRYIYHIVGIIITVAGVLVLPFLNLLVKGGYPSDINLYLLYIVYLSNTAISYFAYSYKNVVLIVNQRRDILSKIELYINLIRSIIQIFVLLTVRNYYCFVVTLPIFTLISNILVNIISNKYYPSFNIHERNINKKKLASISVQVKGVALGKLSLVARNAFDNIILSALCGLTIVTIYGNYYYVISTIWGIMGVVLSSMSASIGNSLVTETLDKNYNDHNRFDFYYMWITGWCTICLLCLYQHFMDLWVGEKLVASSITMSLFCVYFYVDRLAQIRALYSEAAGLWWNFRFVTITEMIANVLLNFVMGYRYQMDGILLATIITSLGSSFFAITIITFKVYFKKSVHEYFTNNLVYVLVTIGIAAVLYNICERITIIGGVGLLVKACVLCICPNVLYFGIYFLLPKYRGYLLSVLHDTRRIIDLKKK